LREVHADGSSRTSIGKSRPKSKQRVESKARDKRIKLPPKFIAGQFYLIRNEIGLPELIKAISTEIGQQYVAEDARHKCRALYIGKDGVHTPAKPPEAIPATLDLKPDSIISGPFALSRDMMPRAEARRFLSM